MERFPPPALARKGRLSRSCKFAKIAAMSEKPEERLIADLSRGLRGTFLLPFLKAIEVGYRALAEILGGAGHG